MLRCAVLLCLVRSGWDHRLCIWEVDTKVVGAGKQEQRESESALVVAAAGERDRSVGRVAPVVNEVSLHANPLSALAASADHLFTGASRLLLARA
jgi:hypothetical protein